MIVLSRHFIGIESGAHRSRGFALVELLVVIAIIACGFDILVTAVGRARNSAQSAACLNNLRQIGQSLHSYSAENGNRFPDPGAASTSWESVLQTYLGGSNTDMFRCPADGEIGPHTGSSYDWRDTGVPATTLAGKSAFDISRSDAVLSFESLPGWHAKKKMNVVRIDGSCTTLDGDDAIADLLKPIR